MTEPHAQVATTRTTLVRRGSLILSGTAPIHVPSGSADLLLCLRLGSGRLTLASTINTATPTTAAHNKLTASKISVSCKFSVLLLLASLY